MAVGRQSALCRLGWAGGTAKNRAAQKLRGPTESLSLVHGYQTGPSSKHVGVRLDLTPCLSSLIISLSYQNKLVITCRFPYLASSRSHANVNAIADGPRCFSCLRAVVSPRALGTSAPGCPSTLHRAATWLLLRLRPTTTVAWILEVSG